MEPAGARDAAGNDIMAFREDGWIWMNGRLVPWKDATVHVATHALHYGTGIFEGIRAYDVPARGPCIFRLADHMRRLSDSCRVYRMEPAVSLDDLTAAVVETVGANGYRACYIRPLVYRGYSHLGLNPLSCPVHAAVMVWEWGTYLGADAIERGVDAAVSSWRRMAPDTAPTLAKATANYASAGLITMEASMNGFAEAIALDTAGFVSEGAGQNLFLARHGVLYTPPLGASILEGITRASVVQIAGELGYDVREQVLPREVLYLADEAFYCGTAVEVTPIRSIDRMPVGDGSVGPITRAIQARFFGIIRGEQPDVHGWLTPVGSPPAS